MIRPLRARHRWTVLIVAVVASALVIAGLLMRPEFPDSPGSSSIAPPADRSADEETARWA